MSAQTRAKRNLACGRIIRSIGVFECLSCGWGIVENVMSTRNSAAVAAIAGYAMLALFSFSPASALTLSAPSLEQPLASLQIDNVQWRGCGWGRCGGWRHHGWGWGPGAVIGGLAAGALLGSAIVAPGYYGGYYGDYDRDYYGGYYGAYYGSGYSHCWRGYYGRLHCSY